AGRAITRSRRPSGGERRAGGGGPGAPPPHPPPLLSGGRITAVGTHHELLRTNAEYAHLMSGDEETER
ncbi:hypothetical protein ACFW9X_16755, partial [Streptomyces sp. NPDC059466]|uniref:hypothetical protein n=1 Tax=Streptomyces sp. NPDC059466 TaxID=3346843 RepID=UPI0036924084